MARRRAIRWPVPADHVHLMGPPGWPMPSRRVTARLRPDEKLVAATRQHWVVPASTVVPPTALAALLIWLATALPPGLNALLDVGWVIWLGLLVRTGWRMWRWAVSWFAVTDERLLLSYGRLTHKLAMMPLNKVTDMTYVRSSAGQLLGFGEFVMESAGQDQALHRVRLVPRSQLLYDVIYDQLARRDRRRGSARTDREDDGRYTGDDNRPGEGRGRGRGPRHDETQVVARPGASRGRRQAAVRPSGDDGDPSHEQPEHPGRRALQRAWSAVRGDPGERL